MVKVIHPDAHLSHATVQNTQIKNNSGLSIIQEVTRAGRVSTAFGLQLFRNEESELSRPGANVSAVFKRLRLAHAHYRPVCIAMDSTGGSHPAGSSTAMHTLGLLVFCRGTATDTM